MRDLFPEFNKPTGKQLEKLFKNSIFVFDTNVLIDLYRLSKENRTQMINTLKEIQERIWLPHHVALEFYRKRQEIICEQERSYEKISNTITDYVDKLEESLKKSCERHPFINGDDIIKGFRKAQVSVANEIEKKRIKHPDRKASDDIEIQLNKLFKGKVGRAFTKEELIQTYELGEDRYKKEIPPGYMDQDKKDKTNTRKFGDLVIWLQIIEMAKTQKKSVIFITNEKKEDWLWKIDNNLKIGTRHELIREFYDNTGETFLMYNSAKFLEHVATNLKTNVDKNLIDSIRDLKDFNTSLFYGITGNNNSLQESSVSTNDSDESIIRAWTTNLFDADYRTTNKLGDAHDHTSGITIEDSWTNNYIKNIFNEELITKEDTLFKDIKHSSMRKKKSKKISKKKLSKK